jgi:hypothetical protein
MQNIHFDLNVEANMTDIDDSEVLELVGGARSSDTREQAREFGIDLDSILNP